jgi:hypothetical protein
MWSISRGYGSSRNGCVTTGILQWSQGDELEIESEQNSPDLENRLYIIGCATVWTVALRRTIFKWKKGFATIILGLIYYSMVVSQPPFHDTVPYSKKIYVQCCGSVADHG